MGLDIAGQPRPELSRQFAQRPCHARGVCRWDRSLCLVSCRESAHRGATAGRVAVGSGRYRLRVPTSDSWSKSSGRRFGRAAGSGAVQFRPSAGIQRHYRRHGYGHFSAVVARRGHLTGYTGRSGGCVFLRIAYTLRHGAGSAVARWKSLSACYFQFFGSTSNGFSTMMLRSTFSISRNPQKAMVMSISLRMMRSASVTPASPPAPRP